MTSLTSPSLHSLPDRGLQPPPDPGWQHFDMHGLVRMGVRMDAPTAAQTATMFAGFMDDTAAIPADRFDLTVGGEFDTITGVAFAEDDFAYRPDAIVLRTPKLQ